LIARLKVFHDFPEQALAFVKADDTALGEIYLMNQPRLGTTGFDLFVPTAGLAELAKRLAGCARAVGGRPVGWEAFETARIESGIPRFGVDMDETNFPQECGIESRAVSYTKGCYIGQEVLNRIHTLGHVNKELRGLRLADELATLPDKGDKLFQAGREIGRITGAVHSPRMNGKIALAMLRKEACAVGSELVLKTARGESRARVAELPFKPSS
jgi:folate-binding protein YgfZ